MNTLELSRMLAGKGLKVTPQRIALLEAVYGLNNHPTAEQIVAEMKKNHPNISTATVYKILDAFVACGLLHRVKTDRDSMRYDAVVENHHHLYCADSDRIEDYHDEELNRLLETYFKEHRIPGFRVKDMKLQIIGQFFNNIQKTEEHGK